MTGLDAMRMISTSENMIVCIRVMKRMGIVHIVDVNGEMPPAWCNDAEMCEWKGSQVIRR